MHVEARDSMHEARAPPHSRAGLHPQVLLAEEAARHHAVAAGQVGVEQVGRVGRAALGHCIGAATAGSRPPPCRSVAAAHGQQRARRRVGQAEGRPGACRPLSRAAPCRAARGRGPCWRRQPDAAPGAGATQSQGQAQTCSPGRGALTAAGRCCAWRRSRPCHSPHPTLKFALETCTRNTHSRQQGDVVLGAEVGHAVLGPPVQQRVLDLLRAGGLGGGERHCG